jgi:hypothetical protein
VTRKLCLPAFVGLLAFAAEARAQYLGFPYCSGPPRVIAFLPILPARVVVIPVVQKRIIIQQVTVPPVRVLIPASDLSGIDLDVEAPDRLFPPGAAPPRKPVAVPAEPKKEMMKKPEPDKAPVPAVKPPPPPVKPPPEPVKPPPELPKKPPANSAAKKPAEDLWQPRAGAADESRRLVELGVQAFRSGKYGLALFRFQQACDVDPNHARAFFLLGQAHLALGQHREAIEAIQDGLRLQPDWPTRDFRPRVELYADNLDDWLDHRRRLDDVISRNPQDAIALFLRGYVLWFDGQRPQAANWFMRARAVTADPRWIDLFLKHAPPANIAAL